MSAAAIRPVRPDDLPALREICLRTGLSGADASHLHTLPDLVGDIYAAPYALLQPELAFVVEDAEGVAGYVLGTDDTRAFEARCEAEWWPSLRRVCPDPRPVPRAERNLDQLRAGLIHRPLAEPQALVDAYPAHLHINLLPRLQGQDMGRALIDHWLGVLRARGAKGVHLGCDAANARALRFYDRYGWRRFEVEPPWPGTVWMVIDL